VGAKQVPLFVMVGFQINWLTSLTLAALRTTPCGLWYVQCQKWMDTAGLARKSEEKDSSIVNESYTEHDSMHIWLRNAIQSKNNRLQ
jgi:hypothetical protein